MPQSRAFRLLYALMVLVFVCIIVHNWRHRYLNAALLEAVEAKNVSAVRSLLESGADADLRRPPLVSHTEGTPLLSLVVNTSSRSSSRTDQEIACLLIDHGADLRGMTGRWGFLNLACRNGSLQTVRCLLERGVDPNAKSFNATTPLRCAIDYGKTGPFSLAGVETEADKEERRRVSRDLVRLLQAHGAHLSLPQAAELDNLPALIAGLEAGFPVDLHEGNRPTALCAAASRGHLEMMRLLLEHGADVNHSGPSYITALGAAASAGNLDAAKWLLAHGAKINPGKEDASPLELAVRERHVAMAQLLLAEGADPDRHLPDGVFESTLGEAIIKIPEAVPDLLAHDADVNAGNGEPLLAALYSHRPDLARELLKRGAKVHFMYRYVRNQIPGDPRPYLPMIMAIRHSPECKEMLLSAGADINVQDLNGETALTQALAYAPEEVKWLLEHGADSHLVTLSQRTPLDLAAAQGSLENVRLLLDLGADVNARPPRGHTALYWARKHEHTEIVKLLLKAGARDAEGDN